MSLLNAYTQILNESQKKEHEVKGAVKAGQDLASGFKVNKQDGPKVAAPKEDKEHSVGGENSGEVKKLAKEATNPFDALYKKVLAQENWEAEEEANEQPGGDEMSFSGDPATGEGEVDLENEFEGEGEEEEEPMRQVLSALKSAVEALEKVLGEHESDETEEEEAEEQEEGEEEGEEEEEMPSNFGKSTNEEEDVEEEVDAEVLGHALIDLEKLAAGLTNPKAQTLKGAVPVAKGKAQTPKGSKASPEPSELKGKGENLQSKKNDTGLVKKDKSWYNQ